MPSSKQHDSTKSALAPTMVAESMREKLSTLYRQQNRALMISIVSRWVITCITFTILVLLIAYYFSHNFPPSFFFQKTVFIVCVLGVFLSSFWSFYSFLTYKKSKKEFIYSIEKEIPDLEQRLITSAEFARHDLEDKGLKNNHAVGTSKEFLEQLHEDAKSKVESQPFQIHFSKNGYQNLLLGAFASVIFFVVSLDLSEGFRESTRFLVWPKALQKESTSVIQKEDNSIVELAPTDISVQPGDIEMQRGEDLVITAIVDNTSAKSLTLFTQDDQLNWRKIKMLPFVDGKNADEEVLIEGSNKASYTTKLSQITKDTVYYVAYLNEAEASSVPSNHIRSPQFSISLFDFPRIESLSVSYDYPDYTGIENQTEEPGGDIVAPVGTTIKISASVNKEVVQAELFLSGKKIVLDAKNLKVTGSFIVEKDGEYLIELVDSKALKNKNPLEYYIRAIEDRDPEITLRSPGKDKRVMPLEEVVFEIDASDDYGLTQFEFTYSIVGKKDERINFLSKGEKGLKKEKIITGEKTLYLEDLAVQPGDVISYSVSVTDNNGLGGPVQKISDIYFLEVIPTTREFSRANGGGGGRGGGGGGGGADGSGLVKTQKDVIAATWKLKNRKIAADDKNFIADGKIIRDSQADVAERAKMSISRLTERGDFENDSFQYAVIALQQSIKEMDAAINSLDELALTKALQSEQRALQEILKAESQINRTEVATNRNQQGGGGGGQQRDNEDLRELFEMEMGELENRYELPSEAQTGQQQNNSKTNELADKFKELARRQERLTRSQRELARRQEQMTEEQKRRQLEKLQREQEQLRQKLSELSQSLSQSSSQQSSSQQSSSTPSSSQQQSGQSSSPQSQSSPQQSQQQRRLQQALNQMEQAAQSESASQAAAKSQKALENIQQQAEQLSQGKQESIAELKQSIQEETDRLVQQQRKIKEDLQTLSRQQGVGESRSEVMNSNAANNILEQQRELKTASEEIARKLRKITNSTNEDESRDIQQSHQISRSLRPIQERMDTSSMILNRGMVNLSLKLENDIESALDDLKREVSALNGSRFTGSSSASDSTSLGSTSENKKQLAEQVSQLRQTLQSLQQQIENQSQNQQAENIQNLSRVKSGDLSNSKGQPIDEGSRALSEQQSSSRMRNTLNQGRQIARELSQREGQVNGQRGGQNGGQDDERATGSFEDALFIQAELDKQSVEDFLRRPELLEALLHPIVELDNKLKVEAELEKIDSILFSSKDENVPDEYKTKVENYYRVLSESKTKQ